LFREVADETEQLRQRLQEPVACVIDGDLYFHHEIDWEDSAYQDDSVELLYAVPPKPEWIGLTDGEILDIDDEVMKAPHNYCVKFARAIEAKLKEKNHEMSNL
jgi:hypothetical protein